jgi:hypothetical protein
MAEIRIVSEAAPSPSEPAPAPAPAAPASSGLVRLREAQAERAHKGIDVDGERERIVREAVEQMNRDHAVIRVAGGTYILCESQDETGRPVHILSTERDLDLYYRNRPLMLPEHAGKSGVEWKRASRVSVWLGAENRRTCERLVFAPGEQLPPSLYNLWKGWGVTPKHDDGAGCRRIVAHLRDVWCAGDENLFRWVAAWLADLVQRPASKPGTALVLRSSEGTGKGIVLTQVLRPILGSAFVHISHRRHLVGNFNSLLQGSLLLFADEAFWAGDKEGEGSLKSLITEPTITVEQKRKEPYQIANHARIVFASNESWVVPAGPTARRFAVCDVSDHRRGDRQYFQALADEISNGGVESFFAWLLDYPLDGIDLRTPPMTAALLDQKLESLDSVERWWHERLWRGVLSGADDDIDGGGWPAELAKGRVYASYLAHCKRTNVRFPATEPNVAKRLHELAGVESARPRSGGGSRTPVYRFPGPGDEAGRLAHARGLYERWIGGPLDWSGDGERYDGCSDRPEPPTQDQDLDDFDYSRMGVDPPF